MSAAGKIMSDNLFPVVGIGASAGGLAAFKQFIGAIPEQSGLAYVLVQHLDPKHDSQLTDLLQKVTPIPVVEIQDNVKVQPDHIYIIPSNKMLVANDGVLKLSPRTTQKGEINLPIDLFLTSLAEIHHEHAIGVVLSGTGSDGTNGLKAIRANGGITVAQDEASAGHAGMPNSAVQAGVVDFVLPPAEIPQKLIEATRLVRENAGIDPDAPKHTHDVFNQMLGVLRTGKGTDFTHYKQTTVRRRILRRMSVNNSETPAAYLSYLRENKPEQDALYQDLLISVTAFFRDHPLFNTLCDSVFPRITHKKSGQPTRIWVAGCCTGEEAYSIAMCFSEFLGTSPERVQLFATDLSEPAIAKARVGLYSEADVAGVSPQRLREFFTQIGGSYQINKQIRNMCVFAVHDFLKDPPFGKMDFISCRNVLIYMESSLQKKALTTFHYALNPGGFLLLGKSETISTVPDLFAPAQKKDKLFTRQDVPSRFVKMASGRSKTTLRQPDADSKNESGSTDLMETVDELILSKYGPAGVVVNEALEIVNFRGNTTNYLEQSPGLPTHNLLLLAKNGLAFELRNLVHKAKKEQAPVSKDNIPLQINGSLHPIAIEALPLPNTTEPHYLVLFHDADSLGNKPAGDPKRATTSRLKKGERDRHIRQLEEELAHLRDDMRDITEDQEAANEELQSANEELQSGNEELLSLNEELQTGKEELQSTNEELTVVNQEVTGLNEQITEARDYAQAIIANIREPLLVLDATLRIKLANDSFYKTFRVDKSETEGILIYDVGNKQWNIPQLRHLLEKILPEKSTFADFELTHTFPTIGERVMLLNAREILHKKSSEKLILLSIEDITEAANAREKERQAQQRLQFIADAMPQKVWTADAVGDVTYFNQTWLNYTGLSFDDLKNRGWKKIIHPDDWEENKRRWQHSIDTGADFELEHRLLNQAGDYKWHLSRSVAYHADEGTINLWVGTDTEIDEQKKQQEELERIVADRTHELREANKTLEDNNGELQKMNKELEAFTYVSSHDLQEPLRKIQTLAGRLLDKEEQNLTDSGKDSFRRMQKSAARMQQLIQDLLAFSRLNTAERNFENTDLRLIIEDVVGEIGETIEEKHAVIDATKLGPGTVIVFQFRQLMHNLIGNALKFSNPAVPPRIVIKSKLGKGNKLNNAALVPEKNYCHITVEDNGIGFDAKYNQKIFDVFQRLHGREQYNGTGIGLAIVKRIVENHNGIITATGEPDKGARFDIYMPAT